MMGELRITKKAARKPVKPSGKPISTMESQPIRSHTMNLNAEIARKAIVLSEIISPPLSKRKRRKL